ncbi:beta-lactamase-like protein [Boletus coccyginus]|nr:beta-lactamase-like protein [Boletus coccyginus]
MTTLRVIPLGAGQEVGRSCIVLQHRDKTVVCDAGIHPGNSGMATLPFVDHLDWNTVDAILITHFHLDHVGALTYIMEKTNFRQGNGKVYMTHPTKALYKLVMQDLLSVNLSSLGSLFTTTEVSQSLTSIIPVSVHQQVSPCPGVSFTPYHAGHVLGACMFMIDILGLKILYTGDYSREEDHHLVKAEIPPTRPDVLIVESTHGVHTFETRAEKELQFTALVHAILGRGGHVLLPVFALGTAQELLLVLEAYWEDHPDLHSVPIYYTSSLARKCMAVYQTHIHTMNANIRSRFAKRDNPFVFKHVSSVPSQRDWTWNIAQGFPCVVLASPGFMDSGSSRELLELWAPDPRNGVIVTGYSIEGTLAKSLLNEPEEIPSLKGGRIPRRISIDNVSFSAHVDYSQNSEFIELVDSDHVVLVHGEKSTMGRLRTALEARYEDRGVDRKVYTPGNLETLQISVQRERIAQVVGRLATDGPREGDVLSGLLVAKDCSYTLLDAQELDKFVGLLVPVVTQKQRLMIGVAWELVRWHLEGMFGRVEERVDSDLVKTIRVMHAVDVKHTGEQHVTVEWESSGENDMIADATVGLLAGVDKSAASVKYCSRDGVTSHAHVHADARVGLWQQKMAWFLEAHFGAVGLHSKPNHDSVLVVRVDGEEAHVDLMSSVVSCESERLRGRVETVVEMAGLTVRPLCEYVA